MITTEDTGQHRETRGKTGYDYKVKRASGRRDSGTTAQKSLPQQQQRQRQDRRRRRPAAQAVRSRHFDAVRRKRIYFAMSSVFSAPFFTPWPTALAPFFTPCPVFLAAVSVASPVLSAAFSVASPVLTAAFLVACPVSLAASFTSVPTWPYENAVNASSAAAVVKENLIKQNFVFIVPPEELKSSSVAEFYQRMEAGATTASTQGQ